ncbi:unnamed protein product [Staurois parvus]|uniref:Uncharacterized protein n=1 Tax=Staurois parvus TaxID=386267 RepID=A0ABN9DUR2_9NEOB|nr:unnamed protein product [Staurois parvus]
MSAVHDTMYISMEKEEKSQMTERILNLTLEIVYLLTGEKYAAVKITCIEGLLQGMYPAMSERWGRSQNSIAVPPLHSPSLEKKNIEKVEEITNKLIELLTDEVPIRCQDVPESISKENKYLEGHKDLYKDVIIEDQPPPPRRRMDPVTEIPQRDVPVLYIPGIPHRKIRRSFTTIRA